MGKKLIFKDADFSVNAINEGTFEWFITSYTDYGSGASDTANKVNGGWAFVANTNALLQGKTINVLRFKAEGSGTLRLYKGTLNSSSATLIAELSISSAESGAVVTKKFTDCTFASGDFLIIGQANTTAGFYYSRSVSPSSANNNFYSKVPQTWELTTGNNFQLCIDVGYYTTG